MKIKLLLLASSLVLIGVITTLGLSFWRPGFLPTAFWRDDAASTDRVTITAGPITENTKVNNARLVAKHDFELSFPFGGRVQAITTEEGLIVSTGSELAILDTTELELERRKAEAVMRQSLAHLAKVKNGTRTEELAVSSDKVRSSKTTLANSKKVLVDAIRAAYVSADDAVRNAADQTMTDPRSASPQIAFTISDSDLESDVESGRKDVEGSLSDWKNDVNGLDPSDNLTKKNTSAEKKLDNVREFLDDLAYALNSVVAGGSLTQETLDAWKSGLATARSNVSTAKSTLRAAYNSYQNSGRSLSVTESELGVQQAGNLSQDIDISRFQLEEAERALDIADEKLLQAKLLAPDDNLVVKKIYPNEGERVALGQPVITLATAALKLELDIPEEDMAGIAIGNKVSLVLEAFPGATAAEASIDFIEPQEILKNESVYYRAYATLREQRPEWRTGMTGDAKVEIGTRPSALKAPRSAVYRRDAKQLVQRITWGEREEIEVTTGLADATMIEIRSGLQPGDEVARYPK